MKSKNPRSKSHHPHTKSKSKPKSQPSSQTLRQSATPSRKKAHKLERNARYALKNAREKQEQEEKQKQMRVYEQEQEEKRKREEEEKRKQEEEEKRMREKEEKRKQEEEEKRKREEKEKRKQMREQERKQKRMMMRKALDAVIEKMKMESGDRNYDGDFVNDGKRNVYEDVIEMMMNFGMKTMEEKEEEESKRKRKRKSGRVGMKGNKKRGAGKYWFEEYWFGEYWFGDIERRVASRESEEREVLKSKMKELRENMELWEFIFSKTKRFPKHSSMKIVVPP